ncbi:MAG: ABC transporter permease [Bacteroidales bacterium]|nr:ABC transporter permease [Bacteroidales bacterium]
MNSFLNFLKRNKLYALINLLGLTVSMAFVLLLAVYVQRQLSTDAFQKNADRIYVVTNEESVNMGYWLDKHLRGQFPEIEKSTCVANVSIASEYKIDGETVYGNTIAVDSCFFEMFSYDLVKGSKDDWRISGDRCMVSEEFANAHFGDKDPVGRQISIENGNESYPLTVCGVFKDFGNSILKTPDVLIRGDILTKINHSHDEYMSNAAAGVTFVMTYPGADLMARHDDILNWCEENFWIYKHKYDEIRIIPLRDMYFLNNGNYDWTGALNFGDRSFVNLLLAMCLMLLLFAILNYVNLSTALIGFRAKEMATRRLVGATKTGIFMKMIGESTLLCAVAMGLAILLAEALSPAATRVLDYQISIFGAVSLVNILVVIALMVILGFIAGIVPALLIQKAQPIEIVRGSLRLKTKTVYSRIIITLQNVITVVMLVAALTMYLQIRNLITADLGYNTKDILMIGNAYGQLGEIRPLLEAYRAEPFVEDVGQGDGIPLQGTNNWTMELSDGNWVSFQQIQGDQHYFDILGIRVKQDNQLAEPAYWLNEYAFKEIGIDESATEFESAQNGTFKIGGIYYDFKIRPLEAQQSSALIYNRGEDWDENWPWTILVKVKGDHKEAYARLEKVTNEVMPGKLFGANYIEEMIDDCFVDESRILRIVLIFTLLSMLVSGLGLFAMSSYYMHQQRRSVAVKKVFGADYNGVLRELVLSFMKMVGVAFVIGIPVAWLVVHRWLEGYSHRISLSWWIFVLAGLVVLLMAFIAVIWQSVHTAKANPANVLKKE